jgi:hypothetical protein
MSLINWVNERLIASSSPEMLREYSTLSESSGLMFESLNLRVGVESFKHQVHHVTKEEFTSLLRWL